LKCMIVQLTRSVLTIRVNFHESASLILTA
jgi:hypothetical protein